MGDWNLVSFDELDKVKNLLHRALRATETLYSRNETKVPSWVLIAWLTIADIDREIRRRNSLLIEPSFEEEDNLAATKPRPIGSIRNLLDKDKF